MKRAIVALLVALPCAAAAQRAPDALTELRSQFEACAKRSAPAFYRQIGSRELAAEQAFQACATEEQVAVAGMRAAFFALAPANISASWARIKLRLKQQIVASLP